MNQHVIFKKAMANGTVTSTTSDVSALNSGALVAWADVQDALANAICEVSGDNS